VANEDDVGESQLAADLQDIGGISVERCVPLPIEGGDVGSTRADVIEEHNLVRVRECANDQAPHILIASKPMGEEHRPVASSENSYVVATDDVYTFTGVCGHESIFNEGGCACKRRLVRC
jgi:hypothetical protein